MAWLEDVEQSTLDQMESAVYTLRHADDPLLVLRALAELRDVREQLELAAVRDAREREHSWAELAEALRRPRPAVHRKHRTVEQDENHAE